MLDHPTWDYRILLQRSISILTTVSRQPLKPMQFLEGKFIGHVYHTITHQHIWFLLKKIHYCSSYFRKSRRNLNAANLIWIWYGWVIALHWLALIYRSSHFKPCAYQLAPVITNCSIYLSRLSQPLLPGNRPLSNPYPKLRIPINLNNTGQ